MASTQDTSYMVKTGTGFQINLPEWAKTKTKPGKMNLNDQEMVVQTGSMQIQLNRLSNGGFQIPSISPSTIFDDNSILEVKVRKPEPSPKEFRDYPNLKVWDESSIEQLCAAEEGRGIYSNVSKAKFEEFKKSWEEQKGIIRIYYKSRRVMEDYTDENGEKKNREILFFISLNEREKIKKDSRSSPCQASYVIGWYKRPGDKNSLETVKERSMNEVFKKIGPSIYSNYYFEGDTHRCFANEYSFDDYNDFQIKVGNAFHSLKWIIPWPMIKGFKPNIGKKSPLNIVDPKTMEEEVLSNLYEAKRKRTKQSTGTKKRSSGDGAKKRKAINPKSNLDASSGKQEDKDEPEEPKQKKVAEVQKDDDEEEPSSEEDEENKASDE